MSRSTSRKGGNPTQYSEPHDDVARPEPVSACELCQRPVAHLTVHHLVPRQHTKRRQLASGPTALICSACHRQIHTLFDNHYLATELNSLEKLRHQPDMHRFLQWLQKQAVDQRVRVRSKRSLG